MMIKEDSILDGYKEKLIKIFLYYLSKCNRDDLTLGMDKPDTKVANIFMLRVGDKEKEIKIRNKMPSRKPLIEFESVSVEIEPDEFKKIEVSINNRIEYLRKEKEASDLRNDLQMLDDLIKLIDYGKDDK